jgi:hypothetical protein
MFVRSAIARDPLRFGRSAARSVAITPPQASALGDDLKLFLATFGAGFLFVSVLLA